MKKIKKLVLPILLSVMMVAGFIPSVYAEDEVDTSTPTQETETTNEEVDTSTEETKQEPETKENTPVVTPTTTDEKQSTKVASAKDGEVVINSTNFPCEAFRNHVNQYDTDGNGSLSESERTAVRSFYMYGNDVTDLTGIEYFTSLIQIIVNGNLTKLDVSKNLELQHLYCDGNKLTELDVTKNTKLKTLYCINNQLTSINTTNLKELDFFNCGRNNLTSIDVSTNIGLTYLGCYNNNFKSIDISKNVNLTDFVCENNQFTNIDVSNNLALEAIICDNNKITNLDLSNNSELKYLDCQNNNITNLDLSKNTKLLRNYEYNIFPDDQRTFINSQTGTNHITKNVDGTYTFDIKSFIENNGGKITDVTMTDGSTIKSDGTINYTTEPQTITYNYDAKNDQTDPMDVTLTPTVDYQVLFVDGDGNTLSDQSVESGKDATAPANPTKEGYIFTGWDKEYSNVTEPTTVTAEWVSAANASQSTINANDKTIKQTEAKGINSTKDLIAIMKAVVTLGDGNTTKPTSVTCDKYSDIKAGKAGSYNVTFTYTDDNGDSINVTKVLTVEKEETPDRVFTTTTNNGGSSSTINGMSSTDSTVKTGDDSSYELFAMMGIISLLGAMLLLRKKESL
ncbi:MAG: InlB B-repeat-containing protein [Thomasclavelia sp.]|nr:InlB B-repeat-containing protein [Thomasclavelia sp.]